MNLWDDAKADAGLLSPQPTSTKWRCGLLLSFLAHLGLLVALYIPGQNREPDTQIYEISLAGLSGGLLLSEGETLAASTSAGGKPPPSATVENPPYARPQATEPVPPVSREQAGPQVSSEAAAMSRPQKAARSRPKSAVKGQIQERPLARKPAASFDVSHKGGNPDQGQGANHGKSSAGENPLGSASQAQGSSPQKGRAGSQSGEGDVFSAQQVDSIPKVTRRATPVYPSEAKKKRIEGRVVVQLVVNTSGLPVQCVIDSANPQGYFEAAALEAIGRMRFSPGKKAGRSVNTLVLLPFDFRLR